MVSEIKFVITSNENSSSAKTTRVLKQCGGPAAKHHTTACYCIPCGMGERRGRAKARKLMNSNSLMSEEDEKGLTKQVVQKQSLTTSHE